MQADSNEVENIIELMGLLLEEAKRNLVKCDPETIQGAQGEAQAYDRVLRMMERTPLPGTTKEE